MKRAVTTRIRRSALLALMASGAALVAPGSAAANPACGATVTHNVTLHSDLYCPSGDGLDVGKSGITINLNGHTITGGSSSSYTGVSVYHYNNVTVENGTVEAFEYGVLYEYTSGAKISHVKSSGANYGLNVWYSRAGLIEHSTVDGAQYGFYLYENYEVNLTNSKARGNYYGVYDYYSHSTLDDVTADSNYDGFYIDYPLVAGSAKKPAYYQIRNSTANHNTATGFYISDNYGREYQANLTGNTATDNASYGFYAQHRAKGSHNHAHGNGTNFYRVPS